MILQKISKTEILDGITKEFPPFNKLSLKMVMMKPNYYH